MKYIIVIARIPNNYAAYWPGLPDCEATVRTSDELLEEIRRAIEPQIDGTREEKEAIPRTHVVVEAVEVSAARS